MSDWLEQNFASHMFGSGTLTKPTVMAVALLRNVPTDAMTGATIPEVANGGAYARRQLNPSSANWLDPVGADGVCRNHAAVSWGAASGDWGAVSGVAFLDSMTHGAGNVYVHGALDTPKTVGSGDTFSFPSGALTITFQ